MIFAQFMGWLGDQLDLYVAAQAQRAGAALAPAATALAALYVMGWGWLHLTGAVAEPLVEGLKRTLLLGIVLGAALHLWLYNDVLMALLVQGPRELAAALVGAADPVQLIDTIWTQGGTCADVLWKRGGVFGGDVGFYVAGAAVWIIVGALCLYCAFLLALSQVAAAVLLAIGPLFILAILFERTRQLFDAWAAQLLNYGLVGILVALVAGLLLQLIVTYADQTAALGTSLTTVDVLDLLLATVLVLLLLRQVLPIAAGLSRGVALSTLGTFGAGARAARAGVAAGLTATTITADLIYGEPGQDLGTYRAPVFERAERPQFIRPLWRRHER